MSILNIIREDYQFIKDLVERLSFSWSINDVVNEGLHCKVKVERESIKEVDYLAELARLEAILNSGKVPSSYTSIITKKTYYPLPQEVKEVGHTIFCAKTSRKQNKTSQSKIDLYSLDSKQILNFFVEHKADHSYPEGGFAQKVKKAFSVKDDKSPKYALKIFKKNQFNDGMHEVRIAMRSAYCSRILGRTGYAFRRNNKQYLLVDWLPGTTLNNVSMSQIIAIPISKRIKLAQMLLAEIGLLHQNGIIHCDIKTSNVMFNTDSLHIFDFDGARLEKEKITGLYSPQFLDYQLNWDVKNNSNYYQKLNMKSDIYALGATLASLFPDIICPTYEIVSVTVNGGPERFKFDSITFKSGSQFSKHEPLGKLLFKLVQQNPDQRPSSIDEIANELSKLLQNQYGEKFDAKEDNFISKAKIPTGLGREAFDIIEKELKDFSKCTDQFNKRFSG